MIGDRLAAIVGAGNYFAPEVIEPRYLEDETSGTSGQPAGLVRPASTEELSRIMAACNDVGQPVVVQGGRTGMTRAALPRDGELVISLERMNKITDVDPVAGTLVAGAGVPLEAAQQAAEDAGLRLAVDIGSRGSCTIGGMIATNAGGTQVYRHGMMRDQVLGLEAVLADGTIISSMQPMLKNNAGYDLKQILIGCEGTLGIVTKALLRLRPAASGYETALCGLPSYDAVIALLGVMERRCSGRLAAYEVMWRNFFDRTIAPGALPDPFDQPHQFYVLVETEGFEDGILPTVLSLALEDGLIDDALVARSGLDRDRFWAYRDYVGEITRAMKIVEPFDVGAPLADLGRLVERIEREFEDQLPGSRSVFFGHIADGNLHVAIELPDEDQRIVSERIVYDAVRDIGGTVSAEHGIGMLKRDWLGHSRSAEEIALMRRLRAAFDPKGILNPGRIFAQEDHS
ncbi:FAD-binding oxidoreductase [Croceicoccus gelatinilyticus]|uniref:FAD-binding oxidoreductase n=1 Tax=Croceicoccus gelatinilyticus TaxID=2835536 RepID=UPI001BCCBC98|nr:FAD-binding oxidoreductase [Croceicoccus gelatinilyticus]MBS7669415.1 FAD-binding oxidoreductase [Croceicoccus gelatinilyticus]